MLKSSLDLDVCWLAFLLVRVNVVDPMGKCIYHAVCIRGLGIFSRTFSLFFVPLNSDRYILEGKELEFYMKKIQKKKGKAAGGA